MNTVVVRLTITVAALQLIAPPASISAQARQLSVERIFGTSEFTDDLLPIVWGPDPESFFLFEETGAAPGLYRVSARSGERELVIRASELLSQSGTPLVIESYEFSANGSKLLIFANAVRVWRDATKGEYHVWDFDRRRMMPVSEQAGLQMFAKFSPDGRYVGFVREHNIFVTDLRNGRERQLTFDGDEDIINGTTDWVYEEELDLRDAFRFSPDGRRIAFWRVDQTAIQPFYLINELSLYPELVPVRYPKAGSANSQVKLGVVEVSSGETSWIDLGEETDIYVPRMDFAASSEEIWFTRLNRHQNRLDLLLADVNTGVSQIVLTQEDDAWVESTDPIWIKDGQQFLFEGEQEGYNQVYLYGRYGSLIGRVTPGSWDVVEIYGVDELEEALYFGGAGDGPTRLPLYRVGLDGDNFERISSASGSHSIEFNVDFSLYVDEYSTIGVPPVQTLHDADGSAIRTLADNQQVIQTVESMGLAVPEFIRIPGADGTELNGYIIRPPDFDVSKQYPLLMYVYGGPGSQRVEDAWDGNRYLWHQSMAQQGYLVACVDNRGTGARGREFKKQTYMRLGQYESADQIAAARYFGKLPFVDASRIGIWGKSYGGYMSLMSMFRGPGVFKAAISVAPVTDWHLYDTIYTERYMRTPRENPHGYRDGAPLSYVDALAGNLLIVHGTGDDNVHVQNTTQLIQTLEELGKQFDMRLYPNETHQLSGEHVNVNLYGLYTEWLRRNL
jgi:dipeptidyl-peptidase-4